MADKKGNRYSVYQGLDTDPSINWGTVASTISDQLTLLKEAKLQERDAIDKATQDQMDQLNKLPDVNDRSLSKIVLEASDRSKEYLRREMDLVKRGLRKPKDYSLFMQSQKNGYSDFGNVVKNWDKWNTAKQEAITNGTQSDLDMFTAEDIESFGNLKNKTVMTNPANGQIQVVSMGLDKDGNYTVMPNAGKNPEAFANPGSINARMSFDEKRKDTTALVTAETAEIARIVEAGRSENGVVTTMEDYRQSPSFDTWKTETTAKLTSNVYDTTQVLTQSGYVLGRTEAEARKKWESQYGTGEDAKPFDASKFIKVNMSGEKPVPQLSESQVNAAKDIVGNKIESQLDSIQSKTQGYDDKSPGKEAINKKEEAAVETVNSLIDLYGAKDKASMDSALTQIMGQSGMVYKSFVEDEEGNLIISYIKDDGTTESNTIPKGNNVEEFTKNAYRFLVGKDAPEFKGTFDKATKGRDSFDENMAYSNLEDDDGNPIRRSYGQDTSATPKQQSIEYVNEGVNLDLVSLNESEATPLLAGLLNPFGFKITEADALSNNTIKITPPGGGQAQKFVLDGTEETVQAIRDFVNGQISNDAANNQSDFLKGRKSKNKKPSEETPSSTPSNTPTPTPTNTSGSSGMG